MKSKVLCRHEIGEGGSLKPYGDRQRFLRCEGDDCGVVFWYDGPSILPANDVNRKRNYTGKLFPLTADDVEKPNRT